jgi:hypothetical protein
MKHSFSLAIAGLLLLFFSCTKDELQGYPVKFKLDNTTADPLHFYKKTGTSTYIPIQMVLDPDIFDIYSYGLDSIIKPSLGSWDSFVLLSDTMIQCTFKDLFNPGSPAIEFEAKYKLKDSLLTIEDTTIAIPPYIKYDKSRQIITILTSALNYIYYDSFYKQRQYGAWDFTDYHELKEDYNLLVQNTTAGNPKIKTGDTIIVSMIRSIYKKQ